MLKKPEGTAIISKKLVDDKVKKTIAEDSPKRRWTCRCGRHPMVAAQPLVRSRLRGVVHEEPRQLPVGAAERHRQNPVPGGDIDEVFDYARTWVNGKLETIVAEL